MKSTPILFQPDLVKAILDKKKTQTRRIIKPSQENKPCKFGDVGDVLWVKESFFDARPFMEEPLFAENPDIEFYYKANNKFIGCHKWKPSIHMPKEAARLLLVITDLRKEKLLDITENDAAQEGVMPNSIKPSGKLGIKSFKEGFLCKISDIYGYKILKENPNVWVTEFEPLLITKNYGG